MAEVLPGFTGKRGPKTYKAAKGGVSEGNYAGQRTKPATKKHIAMVDKKVKRISGKVMRYHSKNPGNPSQNHMGVI